MAELTVPKVDFSSLGDLPQLWKQGRQDAMRQQTLASLGQGTDADVNALLRSGDLSLAQLGVAMKNRSSDDIWRQQEAQRSQQNSDRSFGLQSRAADRADQTPLDKVTERDAVLKSRGIDPNSPEGRSYSLGGEYTDPSQSKPIPVDTLGGTKFMVRQPGGGFTLVDPNQLPAAGLGAPSATVPSSSKVVGTEEGIARGLYDAPKPVAPPAPSQPVAAQAPNFADRFQGQPAAPADPTAIDPKTGRREGFLATLGGPEIQSYIKKVADYEIDPRTSSIKGGKREQLLSAVAQYDPTYDQNSFGSRAKAIKDFSTGKQGDIVRSFDVAIDHLDTLKGAADALKNGNSRVFNELRNRWREQTGSELPTDFKALVPIVSGEIAKAVVGSQNALADREELRAGLKAAASPEQLNGVITGYKALMAGQLKGLRKQYEDTTGKKNFDSRVREATRKAILNDEKGAKEGDKSPVVIDGYTIKEN